MKNKNIIDYKQLRKMCFRGIDSFSALGKVITTPTKGKLIHIDNGSNILAVAHLDSVQSKQTFSVSTNFRGDDIVHCPQLDDRLGVYVLLKVLPAMGINVDVLLTDDEEIGMSTAQYFKTDKKYNWMFQFDRRLDDVVFYQYGSDKLINEMRSHGFLTGYGSFSDICDLDHLGCEGFNIGCGYQNEHSLTASANMRMLIAQINVFASFYRANKNRKYAYTPTPYVKSTYSYYNDYTNYRAEGDNWSDSKNPSYYDADFGITWGKRKNKGVDTKNKNAYLSDFWYHTYEKNGELVSDHEFDSDTVPMNYSDTYADDYTYAGIESFWDTKESEKWWIHSPDAAKGRTS